MTRTDTNLMRLAAFNLKTPWTGTDEIRAANEIDRLRAKLRDLAEFAIEVPMTDLGKKKLSIIARRALQILP